MRRKASTVRERINTLMSELRLLANEGRTCVLATAAVGRTKDAKGRNSYARQYLSMACLRESGELEFGCDDCLILCPDKHKHQCSLSERVVTP